MNVVTETIVPKESGLQSLLAKADFYDAYTAILTDTTLTPTEIFLRAASATPPWVSTLMSIRNRIVKLFGLKDVGHLVASSRKPAALYEVGDRLGIFNIFCKTEDELVLGIDDRHLDVRVSVLKPRADASQHYVVSTVVSVHNWLGHVYMAPVGRIHPLVVRALMRRAAA
jgi:hypothetical protein